MEKTKKLSVNTALCDMTEITEERLSQYSAIAINAAAVIQSEKSAFLISKYPVEINTACVIKVPDGINLIIKNGSIEMNEKAFAAEHSFLFVSGSLFIHPAAGKALESYEKIMVNGSLIYPEGLSDAVSKIQVNGTQKSYPDNAICLLKDVDVDKYFILRALQDTPYFINGMVKLLDASLDLAALIRKNVTFLCKKAMVMECLFEQSLSLFDEHTEIQIIPDECRILPDNTELDSGTVSLFGKKLYKNGDLTLTDQSMEALPKLEYLKVTGTLYIPEKYSSNLSEFPVEYGSIFVIKGTMISDRSNIRIDKQLLEQTPGGLHVVDCAVAEISEDVPPELIRSRLRLEDIAVVRCSPEIRNSVELVSADVALFEDYKDEEVQEDDDTSFVNAASYKF